MINSHTSIGLGSKVAVLSVIIAQALLPAVSFAQVENAVNFEFRPHCEGGNDPCPTFEVHDPESLETPSISVGEELHLDLVILNPEQKNIDRFRAWIAYDPSAFEGVEIKVSEEYPTPTPGEINFDKEDGYIKISGSAEGSVNNEEIVVAEIILKVIQAKSESTPMIFYDDIATDDAETGIFSGKDSEESNILTQPQGFLFVQLNKESSNASNSSASTTSDASSSSQTSSVASSSVSSSATSTIFTLLQVQGVRVTTEGSTVFLAWDVLPSAELIGYNVYYGTVSGRYIQRKSVDSAASSVTIRSLPIGTPYYFAVRAINAAGQETEFSQEVGVGVGDPKTSTSPLKAGTMTTQTPGTSGSVAGETGVGTNLALFLAASAVIGTLIAFRRQLVVRTEEL